jgi:flagellar biosynthesis/type III secretory pathway chaperone
MNTEDKIVPVLAELIIKECKFYQKYLEVLSKERQLIKSKKIDQLEAVANKRSNLVQEMLNFQDQRLDLMRKHTPESEQKNLRIWINDNFSPKNIKLLMPLAENLRELVKSVQGEEMLHGQTVNFALRMFGGIVSIIRSASVNILTSYGKQGKIKESYNPQSRTAGILKEV